jgi:hypothetical protein
LRKFAAILLMLILLFNLCGYRFVISALQRQADRHIDTRLDNNDYDESQLIEIKMALNLPYQERFTDFERQYGQIELDGKSYTYVKRKIDGDVVIFKCIANESREQLKTISADMAKANSNTDMDYSGKQQQHSSFARNLLSDFDDHQPAQHVLAALAFKKCQPGNYSFYIPLVTLVTPHQPPEC